jgi:hypothetical protein
MNATLGKASWPLVGGLAAMTSLALLASSPVLGQAKPNNAIKLPTNLVIYRGDPAQSSGVGLTSWGSGSVDEDASKILSGTGSLKLTTHGLYQGASMTFAKPVDLGPLLTNQNNYLTITVFPPSENGTVTGPGFLAWQVSVSFARRERARVR